MSAQDEFRGMWLDCAALVYVIIMSSVYMHSYIALTISIFVHVPSISVSTEKKIAEEIALKNAEDDVRGMWWDLAVLLYLIVLTRCQAVFSFVLSYFISVVKAKKIAEIVASHKAQNEVRCMLSDYNLS